MNNRFQGYIDRFKTSFRRMGMGTRLTLILLPLVLIPMLILTVVTYFRSRALLEDQAIAQMTSAAQSQVQVLEEWSIDREQRLQLGSQREPLLSAVQDMLRLNPRSSAFEDASNNALAELENILLQQGQVLFSEVAVVTADGRVLSSTNPALVGETIPAVEDGTISGALIDTYPVFNDAVLAEDDLAIVTIAPIRLVGEEASSSMLIGVNRGARIGSLLEAMQVFWEQRGVYRVVRGNTFVLMEPDILIELPRYSMTPDIQTRQSHPLFTSAAESASGTQEYLNKENTLVLAAYEWIPDWGMGIVAELPQEDIFAEADDLAPFVVITFLLALILVAVLVPLTTQQSLNPLGELTRLSESFAMGDMSARVTTSREDEIGRLSRSFNRMAEDLSELYRSLERRVEARTAQIRTASEVARDAVAIRDVESLLDETVNLITARFDFYHAGVFLVDEDREYAVLRAASSEGGKRMLARGHRIPVGKMGIVGYVTGSGKSRIALDVGADQMHMINPDLPETRSELALPLWSGDQIIGALDVQSAEPDAFDDADVIVLQTMADQLAVAIENARLIEELTEVSSQNRYVIEAYNQLSGLSGYDEILTSSAGILQRALGYIRVAIGMVEGEDIVLRSVAAAEGVDVPRLGIVMPLDQGPMGRAITQRTSVSLIGRDSDLNGTSDPMRRSVRSTIAVPLLSRGVPIGAIAVETIQVRGHEERDVEAVELISRQLASSLENASLHEETQRSLDQLDTLYRKQTSETWEELLGVLSKADAGVQAEFSGPRYPEAVVEGGDELEMPITLRGEEIGTLEILGEKPESWTDDDRIILESVSEEVAIVLEQMRLLEEIQRRASQLQTAAEVAREASELTDLNSLLSRVVNHIRNRFDYTHVAIYLTNADESAIIVQEATGDAGAEMRLNGFGYSLDSESIIPSVVNEQFYYLADDVSTDVRYSPNPLLKNIRCELALPLKIGDRVIGVLDVQHSVPNAFSNDDISVLEILTDQLAVAIQNALLFQETLRRAEREQMVLEATSEIRATADVDRMLQTAVRSLSRAFGARRTRIQLFNETAPAPAGDVQILTEPAGTTNSGSGSVAHVDPDVAEDSE